MKTCEPPAEDLHGAYSRFIHDERAWNALRDILLRKVECNWRSGRWCNEAWEFVDLVEAMYKKCREFEGYPS